MQRYSHANEKLLGNQKQLRFRDKMIDETDCLEDTKPKHKKEESRECNEEIKKDLVSTWFSQEGAGTLSGTSVFNGSVGWSKLSDSINISLHFLDNLFHMTPLTRRGQIIYMLLMILIPLVPILGLVSQNAYQLSSTIEKLKSITIFFIS